MNMELYCDDNEEYLSSFEAYYGRDSKCFFNEVTVFGFLDEFKFEM